MDMLGIEPGCLLGLKNELELRSKYTPSLYKESVRTAQ